MINFNVKRLDEKAVRPSKGYRSDAGIDFYAIEEVALLPHQTVTVSTGIAVEMEPSDSCIDITADETVQGIQAVIMEFLTRNNTLGILMRSRSGLLSKNSVFIEGTIDFNYRNEIKLIVSNVGKRSFKITEGMKLGQGVIVWVPKVSIQEVEELSDTDRGLNGFGSTGI